MQGSVRLLCDSELEMTRLLRTDYSRKGQRSNIWNVPRWDLDGRCPSSQVRSAWQVTWVPKYSSRSHRDCLLGGLLLRAHHTVSFQKSEAKLRYVRPKVACATVPCFLD